MLILGERHPRHVMTAWERHYNAGRAHMALLEEIAPPGGWPAWMGFRHPQVPESTVQVARAAFVRGSWRP